MLIIEDWTFCDDVKTDPRVIRTKKGDLPSPKLEYDPSKIAIQQQEWNFHLFP